MAWWRISHDQGLNNTDRSGTRVPRGWGVHLLPRVGRIRIAAIRHRLTIALIHALLYAGAAVLGSDTRRCGLVADGWQLTLNARGIGLRGRRGLTALACLAVNRGCAASRPLAVIFRFTRIIFFLFPRLPFFPDLFEFYVMMRVS